MLRSFNDCPKFVQDYILYTIKIEGEYSDNPHDSGGKTMYGITEALAREYGYKGDMQDLPLSFAKDLYATEFYFKPNLDMIASNLIQKEVFDSSVNVGSHRTITWLQRCLNVFNRMQDHYKDITVDGIIGNQTIGALFKFLALRGIEGEVVLLKALNCLQGNFYIELAERRETQEEFCYGWINKRISLEK